MVNLDELRARGLHAYELGRLRTAARVAIVLIPIAAVCLLEARSREACACLSVLLLLTAIGLRWRDRRGMENVTTGLLAGSLPLAAGLTIGRLDLRCGLAGADMFCTTFAVLVGVLAGSFIAFREARSIGTLRSGLSAAGITLLAASLGCLRLGTVGVAGVVLGIGLGMAAVVFARRAG